MRLAKIIPLTIRGGVLDDGGIADQGHGHAPAPTPRVTTSGSSTTKGTTTHATSPANTAATPATTTTSSGSAAPSTHGTWHGSTTDTRPVSTSTGSTTGSAPGPRTTPHHEGSHHDVEHHEMSHHEMPRTSGSRIASRFESHPQLAAKVTAMLPAGMSMQRAARGFKNQGQFIAALKASQRTGIPFTDLKRGCSFTTRALARPFTTCAARPRAGRQPEA